MLKIKADFFVLITFFILLSSFSFARTHGKLYSKAEANNLYGNVVSKFEMKTEQLKQFVNKSGDIIMFKIKNGKVKILGKNKQLLYTSDGSQVTNDEIYAVYSTSVVNDLIQQGQSDITTIEERETVTSVTSGETTMEMSTFCPPFCSE